MIPQFLRLYSFHEIKSITVAECMFALRVETLVGAFGIFIFGNLILVMAFKWNLFFLIYGVFKFELIRAIITTCR